MLNEETLRNMILRMARRDMLFGVGRIHLDELRSMGVTEEQIRKALKELPYQYRFYPPTVCPTILLIYFTER